MILKTLQQVLEERNEQVAQLYRCSTCPRCLPPNGLFDSYPLGLGAPRFRCETCVSGPLREAQALVEAQQAAQLPPWDTEKGQELKRERDRRVNSWLWAVASGSPLSETCKTSVTFMLSKLHSLTVDFEDPAQVVWPDEPQLTYGD